MIKPTCKKQIRELDNSELSILRQKKTKSQTRLLPKDCRRGNHPRRGPKLPGWQKQTRFKTMIHTGFERSLILHLRLTHKARRDSDTEKIAISLLNEQELQNSGPKPSARGEILPSQWPQDASSVCKASGQVPETSRLAPREA